jgi:hypothetical protein
VVPVESSSPSYGQQILNELDCRDNAYYYWSILAFVISFLPMLIAYPPWAGYFGTPTTYYPTPYGTGENSAIHLQALSAVQGYDQYVEILYCVIVRVLVGLIGKGYFAMVRFRDNLLSITNHDSVG